METVISVKDTFASLTPEPSWSFQECSPKETSYITHGYYTYPAKFIPQLAARLIRDYTVEGELVVDPFMGSGTTIVESIVNNRVGIGVDINEVAYLVSRVKTSCIANETLNAAKVDLLHAISVALMKSNKENYNFKQDLVAEVLENERIDYWFTKAAKIDLAIILEKILDIESSDIKEFFLVCFAQILKTCSIWLQRSVKPTRDRNKQQASVHAVFEKQANRMIKRNIDLNNLLAENEKIFGAEIYKTLTQKIIKCGDARALPLKAGIADLIVTSPPYVTSYEYADLHQLPLLWLGHLKELATYRKKYIGSAYKDKNERALQSSLAVSLSEQLTGSKHKSVCTYFSDMLESFYEMKRVLKTGAKACVVIGNTRFNGIDILNAEIFNEQFNNIGFKTNKVICREIPSKMLPSIRDAQTGQFAKITQKGLALAYPKEYILIVEKTG